jgi:hypothetical protein
MKRSTKTFLFEFVANIPHSTEQNVLYISLQYSTAIHLCACGCGYEVVTKLSPQRWILTFDGESVSLYPSIGNWKLPCRSHYWITNSRINWAEDWTGKKNKNDRKKAKNSNDATKPVIGRFLKKRLF